MMSESPCQRQPVPGLRWKAHLRFRPPSTGTLLRAKIDLGALLRVILGPARVSDRARCLKTLSYLRCAYGERRRKSGPAPSCTACAPQAMLARIMPEPGMLDLLGALLHGQGGRT